MKSKEEFAPYIVGRALAVEGLSVAEKNEIESLGSRHFFWEIANTLGLFYNREKVSAETRALCRGIIDEIREYMGEWALRDTSPTTVVFGTSGWRGVIGQGYSLFNVHKVLRAIVRHLQSDVFLQWNGYKDFSEVRAAGIFLQRDNRFMGDNWLEAARKELTSAGIKVFDAGMCPTGVGSAFVKNNGLAGSINFTPSHNPMPYAGLKFNPSDGGGAGAELTVHIERMSNELMAAEDFTPAEREEPSLVTSVDAGAFFEKYILEKSLVFDLPKIRQWLIHNAADLYLLIDFMHGASRGYVQRLLGDEVLQALKKAGAWHTLHEDDDYSFHGMKPEPSAVNQRPLLEQLQKNARKFNLALAMDPDADRIRFADARMDIDMNRFAPIAYANVLAGGLKGGVVHSVPSSGFTGKIARSEGQPVVETMVGFKNFREAFNAGKVVMGFEESDGISFKGHTLEKCSLAGFLAALTALSDHNSNLSDQYLALQKKYGYYYPDRAGVDVKGVSVEDWQRYKSAVVDVLQHKLFKVGDTLTIGGAEKTIQSLNTIDGVKIVLDDDSWILLRPSGTEPKFRYYFEVVSDRELADAGPMLAAYNEAAESLLQKARDYVDNAK